jgi:hypothetical protein
MRIPLFFVLLNMVYTMGMKGLLIIFPVATIFILIALPTYAATTAPNLPLEALQQSVSDLYSYSLKIVGLCVIVMFLIAGLTFIIPDLKKYLNEPDPWVIIKDAVIGLVLLFSAYLILNTINPDLVGGGTATGSEGNLVELAPPAQNILQQPAQPANFVQTTAPAPDFLSP